MSVDNVKGSPKETDTPRPPVYLKFLVDFMQRMNISNAELAKRMKLSRQAVYYWFVRDDANISKLEEVFDVLGYGISFSYTPEDPALEPAKVTMELKHPGKPIFGERLEFMNRAIRMYKINKVKISQTLKIGATTIYYWQSHDDCLISNVVEFGKAAGLKLNIHISPKGGSSCADVIPEEPSVVPQVPDGKGEDVRRNIQMIDYLFSGFLRDVDRMMEGDDSAGVRARRTSMQLAELLKEYRGFSVDFDR